MTDEIKKSKAGRKENARASDVNSMVDKAMHELKKADAKMLNMLPTLLDLQLEIATGVGLGKKASITNRKSAIDSCIERAEKYATKTSEIYLTELANQETPETSVTAEETKQVANGAPEVVDNESFEAKRAKWKAEQQAKKEAEKSE